MTVDWATGTQPSRRLTNSEMSSFRQCKRAWWLGTYRGLTPRKRPGPGTPLSIGNLVHDALAFHYAGQGSPVDYAQREFDERVEANPSLEADLTKEFKLVFAMLSGYMEWLEDTAADADLKVVGSESMVEVPLIPGWTLLSKLDAPVEKISTGHKLALEHKTVGDLSTPLTLLRIDTQLLTEHLVRFLHAKGEGSTNEEALNKCSGVLYNMLRKVQRTAKAKPPFYGREEVPHNIFELRNHWHHVVEVARGIDSVRARLDAGESHHTVVPPNPTKDCKWKCEFFKICPLFDDGSNVEGAISANFDTHDPLERYIGAMPIDSGTIEPVREEPASG